MSKVSLDRIGLLRFFDEAPADSRRHATALCAVLGEELGLGLLAHYFRTSGAKGIRLWQPCTQGTKAGVRLDGWMQVDSGSESALYQVEVKNWSAHAIGGRRLALDADPDTLRAYRRERFERVFDTKSGLVTHPKLGKVLVPMHRPTELPVRPLACMWYSLHPEGDAAAFFSVPVAQEHQFERLYFFSMSSYLRSLDAPRVELDMPDALARLGTLGHLMGIPAV